ncbi:MAG: hypothetical protein AAGK47_07105 [Bacteroidota bacterium]
MKHIFYLLFVTVSLATCTSPQTQQTDAITDTGAIKGKTYTLVPMTSNLQYKTAPSISMHDYRNGNIAFNIQNFNLGTSTTGAAEQEFPNNEQLGQHVTVFIDGKEMGKTNKPIIPYQLNDGKYVLTAALTTSYNETLKNEGASFTRRIIVRDGSIFAHSDVRPEVIMYHQPSGTFSGEAAKRVPLDFYMYNVDIKGAYRILLDINNGKDQFYLNSWQPYYIEGLPAGENIVKLYLVYTNGELVDVPVNVVQQTFTVAP